MTTKAPLPLDLQRAIDRALSDTSQDVGHHVNRLRRKEIYQAFGSQVDSTAIKARSWLSIITAQHVLPIFQKHLPHETRPHLLIEMAKGFVSGSIDKEQADEAAADGHELAGNMWGHRDEDVPWNVWLAGITPSSALSEAITQEPLKNLGKFLVFTKNSINNPNDISAQDLTDEELAQMGIGDTALIAATAFACSTSSPSCDPIKLLEFWMWWLTEAIQSAWEITQRPE